MHGTQELAATVATSFLRVTLVPIIDLDVIQFAAETVTAATSAPAPDPCRSLAPTRRRKTSAPHPSAGGHLRELTRAPTWTPVDIVSNRNSGTRCTFSTRKRTLRRGILLHAPAEAFLPVARLHYS